MRLAVHSEIYIDTMYNNQSHMRITQQTKLYQQTEQLTAAFFVSIIIMMHQYYETSYTLCLYGCNESLEGQMPYATNTINIPDAHKSYRRQSSSTLRPHTMAHMPTT